MNGQIQVSNDLQNALPPAPIPSKNETGLSAAVDHPEVLSCKELLTGATLTRAKQEAADVLPKIEANTQVLTVFGIDALQAVNKLNDRMLAERPPVNIPELRDAMRDLSRSMRGIGKKYDPNDPRVLKRYEAVKNGILTKLGIVKSFFQEFLDDIRSEQKLFDHVIQTLEGKQFLLLKNVAYYDSFYELNEQEISNLIYKIGVMELIRDLSAQKAAKIRVGNSNMGDRGAEEKAKILEIATLLDNKIIAFKGRLWVAWAMAPQIRNMRVISVGLSGRIDQTVGITIPTMKDTIVVWLTLSEAEQAEMFNKAVEDTYNSVMTMFAHAAQTIVPAMANSLATPALDPRTIVAWSESLAKQADGIVAAIELGQQKRAELEQAMIAGKKVIDEATQKVNESQLASVLAASKEEIPLEIIKSVPAQE